MLSFDRFEVLTFDCYGTLIDWEPGILSALKPLLASRNVLLADEELLELYAEFESAVERGAYIPYRLVLRKTVKEFGRRFSFVPSESELQYLEDSLPHWKPFADTVDALRALKFKYRLAIISNIDDDLFQGSAAHLKVDFDHVITARQAQSYKPSLNIFNVAINRIGVPKDQILHVAQSMYHDMVPAKQLGLATAWVNRRHWQDGFGATPPATGMPDLEVPDLQSFVKTIGI